jgi:hypothetical protein
MVNRDCVTCQRPTRRRSSPATMDGNCPTA